MRMCTGIFHAWRFDDRSFAFNCCKIDQNNTGICHKEHRSELLTLSAPRYVSKCTMLSKQNGRIRSVTHFTFFSLKVPCKALCLYTYIFKRSSLLLWLRNVLRDSDSFFSSLFSLEVTFLWRNHLACGKALGRLFCCVCISHLPQYKPKIGSDHTVKQLHRASQDLFMPLPVGL